MLFYNNYVSLHARFLHHLIIFIVVSFFIDTIITGRELEKWREWRASELKKDMRYCHPRWPQETKYLQSEIDAVRNLSLIWSTDWWIYFDWFAFVFVLASIGIHAAFFYYSTDLLKEIYHHVMIPLLMILWFRLFKYARPFEGAGPFVVIFGNVMGDIAKWGFLNLIIIIPFTCAFWITFGAISLHPVDGYDSIGPLMYNIFSMMVVGDHQFPKLVEANPILSRLLCMLFIGIVAIVTLNLLIALLSNTFERLYENAVANAIMQRGRTILMLEKWMTKRQLERYYDFIREKGSPETTQANVAGIALAKTEDRVNIDRVSDDIKAVKGILFDRFGKRYGKSKSSIDVVKEDLTTVKILQQALAHDMKYMKMMLQGMANQVDLLANVNTFNRSNNSNNNNNNNDDKNNNNSSSDSNNTTNKPTRKPNQRGHHSPRVHSKRDHQTNSAFRSFLGNESETEDHSHSSSHEDLDGGTKSKKNSLVEKNNHSSRDKGDYYKVLVHSHAEFKDLPVMMEKQRSLAYPQLPIESSEQPGPYYTVNPLRNVPGDSWGSPGYIVRESPQQHRHVRGSHGFTPQQRCFSDDEQPLQGAGYHFGRRTTTLPKNIVYYAATSSYDRHVGDEYYQESENERLSGDRVLQPVILPPENNLAYMGKISGGNMPSQSGVSSPVSNQLGIMPPQRSLSSPALPQVGVLLSPPSQQGPLLYWHGSSPVPIYQNTQVPSRGSSPVLSHRYTQLPSRGSSPVPSHQNTQLPPRDSSPVSFHQNTQLPPRGSSPVPSHQHQVFQGTEASQKEDGQEFGIEIRNERKQKGETAEEIEKKEGRESEI